VHIDKRVDIEDFECIRQLGDNVKLVPRVRTEWGSFGLVAATLNGLRAIYASEDKFPVISLLSGQDYPLKPNTYIDAYFRSSSHKIFMEHYPLPNYAKWENGGGMYRVNKYFLGFGFLSKYMARTLNFLSGYLGLLRRKMPCGMLPYAGSQWWTIDWHTLEYILDYVQRHKIYTQFHRWTFAPDELFFQGILLNAKDQGLKKKLSNDNKRYMKWMSANSGHPDVLRRGDLEDLLRSDALFARKFDVTKDTEVLDLIDEHCLKIAV